MPRPHGSATTMVESTMMTGKFTKINFYGSTAWQTLLTSNPLDAVSKPLTPSASTTLTTRSFDNHDVHKIPRLSLFWVQSPSKGDNRRLRQRGWDGLLACQELLGNLVRTKPRGASVSVEENNNFQRFGENGFFKIKRGTGHCGVSFVFYQAHMVHNTICWSESSECIFSFLLRLVHFTTHLPIVQLPKGIIAPLLEKMFSWFKNNTKGVFVSYIYSTCIDRTVLSFLPELGDFVHERLSPRFQSHQNS